MGIWESEGSRRRQEQRSNKVKKTTHTVLLSGMAVRDGSKRPQVCEPDLSYRGGVNRDGEDGNFGERMIEAKARAKAKMRK